MNLHHPRDRELLAFITGESARSTWNELETHIAECEQCLSRIAELSSSDSFVGVLKKHVKGSESLQRLLALGPGTPDATLEETHDVLADPIQSPSELAAEFPAWINGYRVESLLGRGGFGAVYRAWDESLHRWVAIKVPHLSRLASLEDAELYVREARNVARLDHPNIVPVLDAGSTPEVPCFVVSKYVAGQDLEKIVKRSPLSRAKVTEIVATIAEALDHAHRKGLIHRDIKPGNVLIGNDGTPYLVDFGLALREEQAGEGPRMAGTPAYMSPEQARGEAHRVDERSDIFSLGVILYELLAGRKPFGGSSLTELLESVNRGDPAPLRQHDESIPPELQRICWKAMSKSVAERYATAAELARELREFLAAAPNVRDEGGPVRVLPKGLRSFDAHDAAFFLKLLPGPRNRSGLPESLEYWKRFSEDRHAGPTGAIGLMYGPSGCGKSSFVKAGLLPRLSRQVVPIYLEATPQGTEVRLLAGLRRNGSDVPEQGDLRSVLAAVRAGKYFPEEKKLLLVIDQFEQWLHTRHDLENAELVAALRQCDGSRVQCILLVRDDFWTAVSRFMRELEIPISESENSAAVDLFPIDHAAQVLTAFGRALGQLPATDHELSEEQRQFVGAVAAGLAENDQVVCVRLALFAEMMKERIWNSATLKEVGGVQGLGVAFLEESFSAPSAPRRNRHHRHAVRVVLRELLPRRTSNIKGAAKSYDQLRAACGDGYRPADFADLIQILEGEVRLIAPTDPDLDEETLPSPRSGSGQPAHHYQLTHDFLVPSLREWLKRKQQETYRGRAELRLSRRNALRKEREPFVARVVGVSEYSPSDATTELESVRTRDDAEGRPGPWCPLGRRTANLARRPLGTPAHCDLGPNRPR